MGCGISAISPRRELSRSRVVIIPHREARRGYLPSQTTRLDCSVRAKINIRRTLHLVFRLVVVRFAETFLNLQTMGYGGGGGERKSGQRETAELCSI